MRKEEVLKNFPDIDWEYDFKSSKLLGYKNGEKYYIAIPKLINYKDVDWLIENNDIRTT